jgi:hypothetical protein
MRQQLAKATIRILDGNAAASEVEVLFNPAEYSVEYSASYQETAPPGLNNPIIQFVNGNARVLTMDLFFDTYTDGGGSNVSDLTSRFTNMLGIDGSLHAPPRVEFRWGVFKFTAIVEKVTERFTMFLADGTPVRATLAVTFKQYQTVAEQLMNPRRNSSDKTQRRVLEVHDSVWLMADREYGDPRFWRLIARANRISEPRKIEPGTVLTLPPVEDYQEVVRRAT